MGKRATDGEIQYLLKWSGFSSEHNTWEPMRNLNCDALVQEFEKLHPTSFHPSSSSSINAVISSNSNGVTSRIKTCHSAQLVYTPNGLPERVFSMIATGCTHTGCSEFTLFSAPFCPDHLRSQANLEVFFSEDYGCIGLRAVASPDSKSEVPVFKPGDILVPYLGEVLTEQQAEARYGHGQPMIYGVEMPCATKNCMDLDCPHIVDALVQRCAAAMINTDSLQTRISAKLEFTGDCVNVIATQSIFHHDEILLEYNRKQPSFVNDIVACAAIFKYNFTPRAFAQHAHLFKKDTN